MKSALFVLALALGLASPAQAQHANHFTYTGDLRVGESVVARTGQAPLSQVRFRAGDTVEVTLQHEGFTLTAEGTRAGLQMHVHSWTMAHAHGFQMHVPPDARLDVLEASTEHAVIFQDAHLGEVTLGRPHALPTWIVERAAAEDRIYTHCDAVTLYPQPREAGEPLEVAQGMSVYTRPLGDEFEEAWVRLDGFWVRGYAHQVQCTEEAIDGGLGISGSMSSESERPPRVLLPVGLRLVSPAHPARVVMRVTRPVEAISWGPGWTSANDEAALMIALPCGHGEDPGRLIFTPSQLMPWGAPPPS